MKYYKFFAIAVLACLGTFALQQVAKADLTVADTVKAFNELNTNQGARFTFSSNTYGEHQLTKASSGSFVPSLDAYSLGTNRTAGSNYFNTFCVESGESIENKTYYGKLSYKSDGTTQSTSGYVLSVGGAYLYQQFATGALQGYFSSRSSMKSQLQNAIHFLTTPSQVTGTTNWNNNTFLKQLLAVNLSSVGVYTDSQKKTYWTNAYNLDKVYAELGSFSDYAVFVLNIGDNNKNKVQDQLYVAKVDRPSSDVPEPATMLLWLIGGASALGYAKKRRKVISLA